MRILLRAESLEVDVLPGEVRQAVSALSLPDPVGAVGETDSTPR
jgi:hypothetical protein